MVDTRSAGAFGIAGGLNFRSGDISGTAAKTSDDRQGRGTEYYRINQDENEQGEKFRDESFTDRSVQLHATLNSLALMNVAGIINKRKSLK